ncbi:hypothetical protein, partial [Streptomyces sp. b94]|uniref:hypothetical protein n=1 Tax=Streptomyces sp. b94 TaxID=1827634 RepID=UPI00211DA09A
MPVEHLPQGCGHLGAGAGVERDAGQLERDPVPGGGRRAVAQGVEVVGGGRPRVAAPGGPVGGRLQACLLYTSLSGLA